MSTADRSCADDGRRGRTHFLGTAIASMLTLASILPLGVGCSKSSSGEQESDGGTTPATDASSSPTPSPSFSIEETTFDFGTIFQQESKRHSFEFENRGDAPLTIVRVKSDCGCTIPRYPKEPIDPGTKDVVEIVFDSGSLSGPLEKYVNVYTNDPERPVVKLIVKGTVKREVWAEPSILQLGELQHGEKIPDRTVRIHWLPETKNRVTEVMSSHPPSMTISELKPFEDDESVGTEFTVKIDKWEQALQDASTISHYEQMIVVKTDSEKYPTIPIQVLGVKRPPARVHPPILMFGALQPGVEHTKAFRVLGRPGVDLKVSKVECALEFVSVSQHELPQQGDEDGKVFEVTVTIKKDAPKGTFKEHVKVHTNQPDLPIVSEYIYGQIQ